VQQPKQSPRLVIIRQESLMIRKLFNRLLDGTTQFYWDASYNGIVVDGGQGGN
jgi:hypothetical protein